MTDIKFYKKDNKYLKIEATGHTGYDESGKDILCASISSILQSGALGLKKVLNLKVKIVNKIDGYILIELPVNQDLEKAQVIMLTMLESLKDLQNGYSDYIKLEVIDYVY
ncbi:MAG: ribosomal-processing cysteine protease Prp [Eubacteriales bacterium]|nr:ribosomal-processing cysteine protease Prp [Eubacteriales bacterium]